MAADSVHSDNQIYVFSLHPRGTGYKAGTESRVILFTSNTLMKKMMMMKALHMAAGEDLQLTSSFEARSWGGW